MQPIKLLAELFFAGSCGIKRRPSASRLKACRIELQATENDRSSFLLAHGRLATQRVLADREQFALDADGQQQWERINSRPARSLPGLARLLERPSPLF